MTDFRVKLSKFIENNPSCNYLNNLHCSACKTSVFHSDFHCHCGATVINHYLSQGSSRFVITLYIENFIAKFIIEESCSKFGIIEVPYNVYDDFIWFDKVPQNLYIDDKESLVHQFETLITLQ